MTVTVYQPALTRIARGDIDLVADDLRILLVTAGYVPDFVNHDARNDIADVNVIAESASDLPSKALSIVSGKLVLTADPVTIFAVPIGAPITQAILYARHSTQAVSWLLVHYTGTSGLPYTPDGGNAVFGFGVGRKVITLGQP